MATKSTTAAENTEQVQDEAKAVSAKKASATRKTAAAKKTTAKKTAKSGEGTGSVRKKSAATKSTKNSKTKKRSEEDLDEVDEFDEDADLDDAKDEDLDVDDVDDLDGINGESDDDDDDYDDDDDDDDEEEDDKSDAPDISKQKGAFVVSDDDDDDEDVKPRRRRGKIGNPKRRVVTAGATADPVKDYLKQIGRVSLLNAEQEVDLSERIEAGLYAQHLLDTEGDTMDFKRKRELKWAANDGKKAKDHLLEANLRLVVSLAKRYTGRAACCSSTCIQEGNLGLIRRRREVRLEEGLQVLHLCHMVDPSGHHPSHGRSGSHRFVCLCTWSRSSTSCRVCSVRCWHGSLAANPRLMSWRVSWICRSRRCRRCRSTVVSRFRCTPRLARTAIPNSAI